MTPPTPAAAPALTWTKPLKKCPACGAGPDSGLQSDDFQYFDCGLVVYLLKDEFYKANNCRNAFAASVAQRQRADALVEQVERLKDLLNKFSTLPNDISYAMGLAPESNKLDRAYAEGWNDLRIKIGREMLELLYSALAAAPPARDAQDGG